MARVNPYSVYYYDYHYSQWSLNLLPNQALNVPQTNMHISKKWFDLTLLLYNNKVAGNTMIPYYITKKQNIICYPCRHEEYIHLSVYITFDIYVHSFRTLFSFSGYIQVYLWHLLSVSSCYCLPLFSVNVKQSNSVNSLPPEQLSVLSRWFLTLLLNQALATLHLRLGLFVLICIGML